MCEPVKNLNVGLLSLASLPGMLFAQKDDSVASYLKSRPNVVMIYADDLGFGDLECYGAKGVETPNVNRLSDNGLRFTNAHAVASTSTPSRYSLLTIQHRQGIEPSHLFDDIHVIHQAASVMIESILRFTVDRCDEHDGGRGVFLDQAAHQGMASAVKGIRRPIRKGAHGRIAVTEVIGAAEHHDQIRVGIHSLHTGAEILIPLRIGGGMLTGNAGTANSVVTGDGQSLIPLQHSGIAIVGRRRSRTEGDAVTQEVDFQAFQFHTF